MTVPPPPGMPPPPPPGSVPDTSIPPPRPPAERLHDLDALRAFAMLLGIGLHAAVPFVPYRRSGIDSAEPDLLDGFFLFVHGFRMPLFFVLSGFFTTLLWRRRGLRALLGHRLQRVAAPLALGVVTIIPAIVIGIVIGYLLAGFDLEALERGEIYDEGIEANTPDTDRAGGDELEGDDEGGFSFAHLWFLWFLLWLVAAFAIVAGCPIGVRGVGLDALVVDLAALQRFEVEPGQ
ncbi:MAG: acyltransferase family protein [Actinomycetota bacterium]